MKALSKRERQIVVCIASGYRLTEIANGMGFSVKTVSEFRRRAEKKIGCRGSAHLTQWALANRLVTNQFLK